MTDVGVPRWLTWAREIQALGQTGLAYSETDYDLQRYHRLTEIAAEIIESHSDLAEQQALDHFLLQPGYATPKVDVRAAVFDDDRLLFVREVMDGGWTLPGGWADVGDTPSQSIEREVLEEAGLEVKCQSLIGVYDANRLPGKMTLFHAYKLLFLCQPVGGSLAVSHETSEALFFSLDEVPVQLSGFKTKLFFDKPTHCKAVSMMASKNETFAEPARSCLKIDPNV